MKMRHLIVVILAVIGICFFSVSAQKHSVTFGKAGPEDRLLYSTLVKRPAKKGWEVSENVFYPGIGGGASYDHIFTEIRVTDKCEDGTGGYAYITEGGIGQRSAKIHFISQLSKGYEFLLEIFGH
uniref:Venom polypeptide n=1 Tax=Dolopus genitalis TaxID=2488630 RepID=A0A3G5BIC9_DOLGE|nr:venom polypeptide [Dolopus genitalis]